MRKHKILILTMALFMFIITGCEEDEIDYPPKINRLEVTMEFSDNTRSYTAKDNVQIIEGPASVFTFTAEDEVNGLINESWTLKFEIDPGLTEQELLISDSFYNMIGLNTPEDDLYGDYLIEKVNLNAELTKIIITKYIPGEEIEGEFYGNIHELGTTSNDSLRRGFFHTNNFVTK